MDSHDARFFSALTDPLPPLRIGESLVLQELAGEGGMGQVFRAWDERLERTVAVKLLHESRPDVRERAQREAKALARLSHAGVVQVHDVGQHDGDSYIVMEWVDGPSLADVLPLPIPRALEVVRCVADALAHAHRRGLIHRDVKPANVLLADGAVPKVTDFGVARVAGDDEWVITRADQVAGTPYYMPPEAMQGASPDPRWDVFALGVLLRAAITGSATGDLSAHSRAIGELVKRATADDPAERFADADAFRNAIERVLAKGVFDGMPPEYPSLAAAASLAASVASACVLWVVYLSFSPVALPPEELRPLLMITSGELDDGRVRVLAQFHIGPTLLAALAVAVMLAGYGGVRRYWRVHGLEAEAPERPVASARTVLGLGLFQTAAYSLRLLLFEGTALAAFAPVLGGLVELVTLWFFWSTLLEMQRRHRPWVSEWRLWVGLAFALIPPIFEMANHVWSWLP
ncbi:MAG: serine/threonine-protein kinase [Myxococcota bacterium]